VLSATEVVGQLSIDIYTSEPLNSSACVDATMPDVIGSDEEFPVRVSASSGTINAMGLDDDEGIAIFSLVNCDLADINQSFDLGLAPTQRHGLVLIDWTDDTGCSFLVEHTLVHHTLVEHTWAKHFGRTHLGRTPAGRTRLGKILFGRTHLGRTPVGRTHVGRTLFCRTHLGRTPVGRTHLGRTLFGRTTLVEHPLVEASLVKHTLVEDTLVEVYTLAEHTLVEHTWV